MESPPTIDADSELEHRLGCLQGEAMSAEAEAMDGIYPQTDQIEQNLEPSEAPAPALPTADAMTMLVATVTNLVAVRRGEFWRLQREEAEAVGQAYGALIDAWLPPEKVGPGVMAIMVTGMVFGPRLVEDHQAHNSEEKEGDETGKETNPGSTRAHG